MTPSIPAAAVEAAKKAAWDAFMATTERRLEDALAAVVDAALAAALPHLASSAVEDDLDPNALKAALAAYDACFPDAGFVTYDGFFAGLRAYLSARPAVDSLQSLPTDPAMGLINPGIPEPARSQITEALRSSAFWVIELIQEPPGPVPRYWGGGDIGFVYEIGEALQFVRKRDAENFLKHSRVLGRVAEHAMIAAALRPVGEVAEERDEAQENAETWLKALIEALAERDEARRERDAWQSAFNGADKLIAALTAEHDALAARLKDYAEAVDQALDDMGAEGLSCCGASKAMLRRALGDGFDPECPPEYTYERATKVLIECGQLPEPRS